MHVAELSLCFFSIHIAEHVAVKVIDKTCLNESTRHVLSQEISCMAKLNHPNLIRLFEVRIILIAMVELYQILVIYLPSSCQGQDYSRTSVYRPLWDQRLFSIYYILYTESSIE